MDLNARIEREKARLGRDCINCKLVLQSNVPVLRRRAESRGFFDAWLGYIVRCLPNLVSTGKCFI